MSRAHATHGSAYTTTGQQWMGLIGGFLVGSLMLVGAASGSRRGGWGGIGR